MKKAVAIVYLMLFCTCIISCAEDNLMLPEEGKEFDYSTLEDGIPDDVRYYANKPYPTDSDTLRILAIGNSFTEDATQYLNQMVEVSGIDPKCLCIYTTTIGGAGFSTWIDNYNSHKTINITRVAGEYDMHAAGSLADVLPLKWDVIVVQQASDKSYLWNSYNSLREYVDLLVSQCGNKDVCLVFQLVWSHTTSEMPYVLQGNIACCQKMMKRYGIDVIIPTGTAIQRARNTEINDNRYLTRDNWHLNYGIGRYIASCTWFEALLKPVFNISVIGNTTLPEGDYTATQAQIAQQCAIEACANLFLWE